MAVNRVRPDNLASQQVPILFDFLTVQIFLTSHSLLYRNLFLPLPEPVMVWVPEHPLHVHAVFLALGMLDNSRKALFQGEGLVLTLTRSRADFTYCLGGAGGVRGQPVVNFLSINAFQKPGLNKLTFLLILIINLLLNLENKNPN